LERASGRLRCRCGCARFRASTGPHAYRGNKPLWRTCRRARSDSRPGLRASVRRHRRTLRSRPNPHACWIGFHAATPIRRRTTGTSAFGRVPDQLVRPDRQRPRRGSHRRVRDGRHGARAVHRVEECQRSGSGRLAARTRRASPRRFGSTACRRRLLSESLFRCSNDRMSRGCRSAWGRSADRLAPANSTNRHRAVRIAPERGPRLRRSPTRSHAAGPGPSSDCRPPTALGLRSGRRGPDAATHVIA
jgi:hypothetical protein